MSATATRTAEGEGVRRCGASRPRGPRDTRVIGFVRALRTRRRLLELSQRELAARAGIGEKHLGEIERGLRDPRLSTLFRLADGLGLPAGELLRRFEEQLIERAPTGAQR